MEWNIISALFVIIQLAERWSNVNHISYSIQVFHLAIRQCWVKMIQIMHQNKDKISDIFHLTMWFIFFWKKSEIIDLNQIYLRWSILKDSRDFSWISRDFSFQISLLITSTSWSRLEITRNHQFISCKSMHLQFREKAYKQKNLATAFVVVTVSFVFVSNVLLLELCQLTSKQENRKTLSCVCEMLKHTHTTFLPYR